jgi:predicted dehydrogenase
MGAPFLCKQKKTSGMINVGVVGFGYWGVNLARTFAELSETRLHAIVDPMPARLEVAHRRYGNVALARRLDDILSDPALDAVAIATPVRTHYEIAVAALNAGKHVWLEKPMTEKSKEAWRLIELAENRNLRLFVDHTFVYTGAVRKMRELIVKGELGDIYYYDSIRVNLGLFQRDVSVISDLAVHDFSILDYLLAEQPIAVSASGTTHFPDMPENLAYITLFYGSGTIAHINVNWLAPVKVRQILLGGSKRLIAYDDIAASEKVKVFDAGVQFASDPQEIYQLRVGYRSGDMWAPKVDTTEALRVAGSHFAKCIADGCTPITDGHLGMRVVELVEAASASMRGRGDTVELEIQGA